VDGRLSTGAGDGKDLAIGPGKEARSKSGISGSLVAREAFPGDQAEGLPVVPIKEHIDGMDIGTETARLVLGKDADELGAGRGAEFPGRPDQEIVGVAGVGFGQENPLRGVDTLLMATAQCLDQGQEVEARKDGI
jgi:hypothetical protein